MADPKFQDLLKALSERFSQRMMFFPLTRLVDLKNVNLKMNFTYEFYELNMYGKTLGASSVMAW